MNAPAAAPDVLLPRVVRRLARLFRIERAGRLTRRRAAIGRHLIARRAALIEVMIAAEYRRRSNGGALSPTVLQALRELALEVGRCRASAESRRAELAEELRSRRGAAPSGVRGGAGGRLLGTS